MKKKYKLVTQFGPEARFVVQPSAVAPFRALLENAFERLKQRLLEERLGEVWKPGHNSWVRRAANEAAALAWVTPYPLLVFPALFEEKADTVLAYAERQEQLRAERHDLLAV